MSKLKEQQDADRQYDPYSNENARELLRQDTEAGISAGIDQAEAFANDPENSSQALREKEETPNEFNFNPDESKNEPQKFSFKGALRSRKTATGGIIGALIAFLGGISIFLTPGIAAVQMKEILTDDLNDQLGAMDTRSAYVMRAKLNDLGKGVCTGVNIRCGFKGMSDRQLSKFTAAGFDVETDGKTTFGRNRVTSLSITDSVGNRITADNPRQFNRMLGDRVVQSSFRKAFNPKFAGFFDAKWDSFKQKYKLTSQDKLGTGSEEEKRANITSAVEGDPITVDAADRVATTEDGKPVEGSDNTNQAVDRANNAISGEGVSTKSILGSAGVGAIKGVGILGAADTACTVKNTARAVEAGAKVYRYRQLIAYSMVFLTFADSIKAGTATPDQAELVGNTLTSIDTDKTIVTEDSSIDSSGNGQEVDNPYYGANAFDSAGYKTAMYNEAPNLSARDMQMAVGGGMSLAMLSKVNGFIDKYGGGNCKAIQNWAVRGGSIVVGIAAGIITFGGATLASIGASVAISMALPILENYLAQMMAGTVANGDTAGVDTGNAIFAGTAALMGGMAMSRGMKPATKSDLKSYLALNDEVKAEYVAMETEEASKTPFDINNRYSFVGSLARSLLPLRTTSSVSVGNSFMSGLGYMLSAPLSTSTAQAKSAYNEERFDKCEDNGYNELGIDADVFCNVRYVLTPYELSLETDEVREQMLAWGQVNDDEAGSVVADSDYDKWLTECTEREQGWGETESENQEDGDGTRCMSTEKRDSFYRVYTMDASIIAAMDYTPPAGSAGVTGGSNIRAASFNVLGVSHTDGAEPDKPQTEEWKWKNRIEYTMDTITENNLELISFQEFEPAQYDHIKANLPNFELSNHGKVSDSIGWNTTRFSQIDKGTWKTVYFGGPIEEPWVKLKDNSTEQEFYAMSVHDPINRGEGDAQTRYENAQKHLAMVNEFKTQAPVLLMGDFNSGYTKNHGAGARTNEELTYCVLAVDGGMNDAYDLSIPRPAKCPNERTNGTKDYIDHIYLTPEMEVTSFKEIPSGPKSNGSDHPTIFADVVIPGTGENTGAGTDFKIASYNHPARGDSGKAIQAISSNNFDIVGMQELARDNYGALRRGLKDDGYGLFPDLNRNVPAVGCSSDHAIFFKKDKFKLVKSETLSFPRYEDYRAVADCGNGESKAEGDANAPIIWLEDIRPEYKGQTIIVINTHNIANVEMAERPSLRRYQAAKIYVNKIADLRKENPGVPIFFTGDFNEGHAVRTSGMGNITYKYDQPDAYKHLLYCMFVENKLMKAVNLPNTCPDQPARRTSVDFIYYTDEAKPTSHGEFQDPSTNDSPHPVMYAQMKVAGTGPASGSGGSDVIGDDYAKECSKYLAAGDCTGECVGFVKFRLVKHGVINPISLGNGGAVVSTLGRAGFEVNGTPAVHSVFSMPTSSVGHTGIVSAVKADGSIVIEEYNWPGGHKYNTRTLTPKQYKDAGMQFAHTETKYK